jgi:hypothetical protein
MINFLIKKQSKRDATQRRPMIRERDIKLDCNWITSPCEQGVGLRPINIPSW